LPAADYSGGTDDPRLIEHLVSLGFKKPGVVAGTVQQWLTGDYRALRVEATRNAFVEFIPGLIDGLAHSEEPDNAVAAFDRRRVVIAGGVAANRALASALRERLGPRVTVIAPSARLSTDNAAMIARAGLYRLERGERSALDLSAFATQPLPGILPA
jgi:glutamine synthetase adenylyltransferase